MKKIQHTARRIIDFLKKWPVHIILLPAFFVISIYVELAGLLRVGEIMQAFFVILAGLLVFFGISWWMYRDISKAAVITTVAGTLFLFFGNIKDSLASIPVIKYISSYRILLFLLPAIFIFFLYRIRKAPSLFNATLFFNILFLVYLCMETWKWQRLENLLKTITQNPLQLQKSPLKEKPPDIYYIVLDSYPSSQYQQEVLNAPYNFLDTALQAKGFYVVRHSKSNYHITSFSIASTLQMEYLDWMKKIIRAKPYHYSEASNVVKQSIVLNWMLKNGYQLYNLSIFDLPGHSSFNKERFFSVTSDKIIYYNTLWSRIKWQVIPILRPSYIKRLEALQKRNIKKLVGKFKEYNHRIWDSLQHLPFSQQHIAPKFIYAHFEMPHYPYFYDSTGKAFPDSEVFSTSMTTDKQRFRNYIAYTNTTALSLVNTILAQNRNSIIILQSDHGTKNLDETRPGDAFTNYSAFYFPDKDYRLLYDSMSNVNTFRVIFNKYFDQQLPLLKDSSFYIQY